MIFNKTTYPRSYKKYSYQVSNFLQGISSGEYDSGIVPINTAISSYNFDFSGGNLKSGNGFYEALLELFADDCKENVKNQLKGIGSIIKIFVYKNYNNTSEKRDDKLILLSSDLNLFILNLKGENTSLDRIRNITFTSVPSAISYRLNGEDVLIFTSETDNMVVYDGFNLPYEVLDAPKISSMDIHYERLFVTTINEKSKVLFSDDLDPTLWSIDLSEAGFIEMVDERGALNKVISFNDYLYIFRDYGISRLTAFGDQEGFSVSHLFVSSAKIFAGSVTVCGDRILFLANDGLYSFDGFNATKILTNISNSFSKDNANCVGAFFEGKYFLGLSVKFDDVDFDEAGFKNNCLLEYDIKTKNYKITRGVDIIHIESVMVGGYEKLYLCLRSNINENYSVCSIDKTGEYLGLKLKKVWKTDFYGFSKKQKNKCIRSVSLYLQGDPASLTVESDTGYNKTIELVSGANTYNFYVFGSKFKFTFISHGNTMINSPEITILIGGTN